MGFKPDIDDQLVSFSALKLGLVIWPVKIMAKMTYIVLSGTLSLYTTTTTTTLQPCYNAHDGSQAKRAL